MPSSEPKRVPVDRPTAPPLLTAALLAAALLVAGAARAADPLVVGTKAAPPFAIQEPDGSWRGVSIELWEHLADRLGVTYELREQPLAELLDRITSGELDLAVAALTVTAGREQQVDFSHPYFQSNLGVAVPSRPATGALGALSALFSVAFLQAVGLLLLILFVVGVLAWVAERRVNAEEFGGSTLEGIGNGFWWSAVTMTTVGYGDKSPRTPAGRVLGVVWMFTSIIIIAGITGAIASAFTVQSLQSGIETLDDVLRARTGTVANSTSAAFLGASGARPVLFDDLPQALDALSGGELEAVVYDAPVLRYEIAAAHGSALSLLPLEFRKEFYAIALPEGSELVEPLNRALLELLTSREWEEIRQRYLGN